MLTAAYKERVGSDIPGWANRKLNKNEGPPPGSIYYPEGPQPLPLAARRNPKNRELVTWTGADTVLGDLLAEEGGSMPERGPGYGTFEIWDNTVCKQLTFNDDGSEVKSAFVHRTADNSVVELRAKYFVIAAGKTTTHVPAPPPAVPQCYFTMLEMATHVSLVPLGEPSDLASHLLLIPHEY